jgi:geranylgeranylglycerol-phosphate geranylgeranyltransferase
MRLFSSLRVVRASNCFAAFAATMLGGILGRTGELFPVVAGAGSVFFTAAFGYAINDYYDALADRVTKPTRPIPAGTLSRQSVLVIAVCCAALAAVCALVLPVFLILAVAAAAFLVWVYSLRVKRSGLPGNVLVSLLGASTLVFGGSCAGNVGPSLFPALLAFLVNLPREILKDVQDLEGDILLGGQSLVRLSGRTTAVRIASVFMLLLVAASLLPAVLRAYNRAYLVIVLFIDAFVVLAAYFLWSSASQRKVTVAVRLLKSAMYAGLIAIGLGSI